MGDDITGWVITGPLVSVGAMHCLGRRFLVGYEKKSGMMF